MRMPRFRIGEIIIIVIVILSLGLSIFYYPRLPAHMPCHRDSQGRLVQGYPTKLLPTFVFSSLIFGTFLIYSTVPRLFHKTIDERYRYYDRLIIWMLSFWLLGQIHGCVTGSLLLSFNQTKVIGMIIIGSLFYLLGDTFAHAKKGWFVSIANRWTLNQPSTWEKTHRNIGWSFKAAAIFCLLQALLPMPYMIYPIGVCLLFAHYYISFYSYRANRKLKKITNIDAPQKTGKEIEKI